jgi:N-acetylglucosamine kinase-like BadF-type ATPase
MMDRALGLDGGGTKTDAVVVDRLGKVIARQRADGLDPTAGAGWERRLAEMAAALGPVTAAVLGLL